MSAMTVTLSRPDAATVSAMLARDILHLVQNMLSAGRRKSRYLVVG